MDAAASAANSEPAAQSEPGADERLPRAAGDLDLVREALRGRTQAVQRLFDRLRCVARMLDARNVQLGSPLSEHELEDLVQETLLALWQKLGQYDGRVRLESWAFGFAVLQLLDRRRRVDRFQGLLTRARSSSALRDARVGAPSDETDREQIEDVHRALATLEQLDADLVRLKHFDELSFDDIAARLGQPASTVKTRYYRALAHLRFQLRARGTEPWPQEVRR